MCNKILITILLSTISSHLYGQQSLLPIDSLYMDSIEHFYDFAKEHKNEVWPNMELSPIAFYRIGGPVFLYNHPDPPESFTKMSDKLYMGSQSEQQFFGDTITETNGTLTAIVNYGRKNFGGVDEVTATLFHELHHAYQRNAFPDLNPGNPAMGMTYPESYKNDALKRFEQEMLFEMIFTKDDQQFRKLLNQFYSSRLKREELIDDYTNFERSIENFEGPAYYSEYQFYKLFSDQSESIKSNYSHNNFWAQLLTPKYGRKDLRLRHLVSGFAMCYLLDKYHEDWKNEYYPFEMSLFDFFCI